MKLLIDIPGDVHKRTVFYREFKELNDYVTVIKALENGIPLPEGHGRLIDADALKKSNKEYLISSAIDTEEAMRNQMVERLVTTRIGEEKLTFPLPMDIAYDKRRCQYVIHVPKTDRRVDDIAARYELSERYEIEGWYTE